MGMSSITGEEAACGGLVKVQDAARLLQVSPRTVWRMIAEGQFKAVRVRRCTRLLRAELTSLAERNIIGGAQ